MRFLKADTAATVRIGPAVDITDGYTLLATLAISTADYAIASDAGGTETDISSNTWAAVTGMTGWYDLTITAGQLGVEGPLTVAIYDVSLCLPIFCHFHVVNANVYDSLFAAASTDYLQVDTIQVSGTSQTANDNGADINAILTDTNELQTDWTNGGRLDLIVDGILEDTGTTLPATLAALNNLSAAQVNAEVVDALATDTYAELAGVPAATSTLADKINWLFALARNKRTQTGTTATLRNDGDTASISTATVSDDGTTTTRAEWS